MPDTPARPAASVIGIDVGGANLKFAGSDGWACSVDFPMWLRPQELAAEIASVLAPLQESDPHVAAVMTGELADCFLDRGEGVRHIADQLADALSDLGFSYPPQFWGVDGRFHPYSDARRDSDNIAAANWHALATYVARFVAETALLVDIGSTTTDIVPLAGGKVQTQSRTDFDRLGEGALVYVGGERTPVCSVVSELMFRGQAIPVMREVFATMDDVRLLLDRIPESDSRETADGGPRDRFHAANRMARMIGLDHRTVTIEEARAMSEPVHVAARRLVAEAAERVGSFDVVVLSGHGQDLAHDVVTGKQTIQLSDELGDSLSRVAPAYAAAKLLETQR